MTTTPRVIHLATLGILTALSGCSGTSGTEPPPANETYTQFSVRLDGKNEPQITVRTITREQQLARIAAREQQLAGKGSGAVEQAIAQDPGCSGASLWLFDGDNLTGDEICFSGAGTAQLSAFGGAHIDMGPSTWMGAVHSYWAGSAGGGFYGPSLHAGDLFCSTTFGAWKKVTWADQCAANATQVYLNN